MKKTYIMIGLGISLFLIISSVTAVPHFQSCNFVKNKNFKTNIKVMNRKNNNSSFINFILRMLEFAQNLCGIFLVLFNPLVNPLQKLSDFLNSLLEKLEPWGNLAEAIQDVINAVNHLISQGCKKIAHFAGPEHVNIYLKRKKGYLNALKKNEISIKKEFIINNILTSDKGLSTCKFLMSLP